MMALGRRSLYSFVFAGVLGGSGSTSLAVMDFDSATNGHDVIPDAQDLSRYTGLLGSFLGTPISSRYFVTANHIGTGYTTFSYANGTSVATNYSVTFVGNLNDLSVFKIADSDPRSFTLTAPIYTQSTEVNQPLVVLGRGTFRGSPVTVNGALVGWQWGAASGDVTWGTGIVSSITTQDGDPAFAGAFVTYPFSNNGDPHSAGLSGGDSGGPLFVRDPADNTYKLAGVNTGVDGGYSFSPTGPFFNATLFDTRGLYVDGGTSPSTYVDPAANPNPVPGNSYSTDIASRLSFVQSKIGLATISAWNSTGGGDWNSAANWNAAVPNGTNAEADLFRSTTSPHTVFSDSAIKLAVLHFNSVNTYLVTGLGILALQSASGPAMLEVEQGAQTINLPTTISGAATIYVAHNATLTMNQLSLAGGASATVSMHGSEGSGTIQIHSLTLAPTAKLDLTNNTLVITDDSPASVANIRSLLAAGFDAGNWDGNGINSSAAHNDTSFKTALGYIDRSGVITIKYIYYGDNNLDGVVNATDFQMFLDGLVATSGSSWSQGDYTYDGKVDLGNDFNLFLTSYLTHGGALSDLAPIILSEENLTSAQRFQLLSVVPEPSSAMLLIAGTIPFLRRRRARLV